LSGFLTDVREALGQELPAARRQELTSLESWMQFRVRLAQFVDTLSLRHPGQQIYVVAHAAVIAAVFDNMFNVGPYHRCDVYSHNTSLTRFWYRPQDGREPWLLEYHNRTEHLTGDLFPG
jgi:probable phosphoglycerate mutase